MIASILLLNLSLTSSAAIQFPIGIYNVTRSTDIPELLAAGVTHIIPNGDKSSVAAAAHAVGLGILDLPEPSEPPSARPYPIAAWYIADEPEINRQSTAAIAALSADIRGRDPLTPLVLVVGAGKFASGYADSVDYLMVDWYPVPHLPLRSLGDNVLEARELSGSTPVWAVIQAMDWRDYPQRDPKKPRIGRFPSRSEMRFMAFHAISNGASGVFFFEFQRRPIPGKTLLDSPEHWDSLKSVLLEIKSFRKFFASGRKGFRKVGEVEWSSWETEGSSLALVVNPTAESEPIPKDILMPPWRVRNGGLTVGPDGLRPDGRISPYGVVFFEQE